MNRRNVHPHIVLGYTVSAVVFLILIAYTYAKFFQHAYLGFRVDSTGEVIYIFDENSTEPTLKLGDRLIQVESVHWEDFRSDLRKTIFPQVAGGEVISLVIDREGREMTIPWVATGPNSPEIVDLLVSEGWLAFFFWFAGTITLLNLRPRDDRWYLMIAFNYLTGLIIVIGSGVSFYHIWGSAVLLRMFVWLCVPVYLHLHWIFPYPFRPLPRAFVWVVYLSAVLLAIAEGFDALPRDLYFTGFLLAFAGSVILIFLHAVLQPNTRRDLSLFLVVSMAAFLPSLVVGIIGVIDNQSGRLLAVIGGGALLSLPLVPAAYFYAAYRRQLGNLELRVNRLLTGYLFFTLLAVILILPISWLAARYTSTGATILICLIAVLVAGLTILSIYPRFESIVERRVYGVRLPSKNLLEVYSTHITTSSSRFELLRFLEKELLPSLLVKQFVFIQMESESMKVLMSQGVTDEEIPSLPEIPTLTERAGNYLIADSGTDTHLSSWIRLILPLRLGDQLIGFWLFGRRDPDDLYAQKEIPTLSSLANLTAIALSNIRQTERLTSMYQANIKRYEEERVSLARDLHDSILNELAALPIRSDAPVFPSTFQQAYERVSEHLREIVNDFRPPMLGFGLKLALEAFVENIRERNPETVEILTEIRAEECRYPLLVENNLYRIVQEACENSLRYSQAKRLSISGQLAETQVYLEVVDDGLGIDPQISLDLDDLAIHKHFGLTGMHERASVIGAELQIVSKAREGTQIYIRWKPKDST